MNRNLRRRLVALLFAAALIPAGIAAAAAPNVSACLECHGDPGITKALPDGKEVSLHVDLKEYGRSVHGGSGCVSCHADAKAPHGALAKVSCGRCHGEAARSFGRSSHGKLQAKGVANAPACSDCHGKHDVRKSSDPASRTFRLNVAAACTQCHKEREGKAGAPEGEVTIAYARSVHGMASKAGQMGSAVCSDCHGNHAILPGDDPKSAVNRQNIPTLCGKCHTAILDKYEASVHGKGMRGGIPESPVCTDCHGEHAISRVTDPASPVAAKNIPRTCSRCHDKEGISTRYALPKKRFSSYLDSFHGIAVEYGMTTAANCSSCHGMHDILPSSDPASSINKANLPKTCGKCHPNAGPNFARGPVHVEVSPSKSPGVFAIRLFYILFISSLGILFLLHVGFELYGRWTRRREGRHGGKEGPQ